MQTCLYQHHNAHKAVFTDFFGWQLPRWFSTASKEHQAVRTQSGIFDVSHMGLLQLSGDTVLADMQYLSYKRLTLDNNRLIYTLFLNQDGGILDDLIIGKSDEKTLFCVVNASNKSKIIAWIRAQAPTVVITECNATDGLMAWQGPDAWQLLAKLAGPLTDIKPFHYYSITVDTEPVRLMRTGYTGEDGVELWGSHQAIQSLWSYALASGATPCGLAARDSLRIEAGLPLYGQELTASLTPYSTRYATPVSDHDYSGKAALSRLRAYPVITGLVIDGPAIPRPGMLVMQSDRYLGVITSGTKVKNRVIAMALFKTKQAIGTGVTVRIRQRDYTATIVSLPFYTRS